MSRNWGVITSVIVIILVIVCCLCICLIIGTAVVLPIINKQSLNVPQLSSSTPTHTPVVIRPTEEVPLKTQAIPDLTATPLLTGSDPVLTSNDPAETLRRLREALVPINDLHDIAKRLEGKTNVPATIDSPTTALQVGNKQEFWVSNVDTNENFQIQATLRYVTDHAYFWIQDDVDYYPQDLEELAETFENKIYPTNRDFFGSEWTPGVDGDVHLYLLYASDLGETVAGYFNSADEYHPQIQEYSNTHEMFLMSADNVGLDEEYTYGVLAHEFQHMIHWYRDRNESAWINEGFSDLAMFLNGYSIGGHDYLYVDNPDIQLNDWPTDHTKTGPHYGASFLFMAYFLDRFGDDATQALVADPENSMESITNILNQLDTTDPVSGESIDADDVFIDWVMASYLLDGSVADGRYTYHNYTTAPQTFQTETIQSCPTDQTTRDVHQYGVDYIRFTCRGNFKLHFEGSTQVALLPEDPYSGAYAFWSNKGDDSDMTLTRSFDFTDHDGQLTLDYWTWYDLEEDFDYLYLEASLDGESWQILDTPSGTGEDPTGSNYGWGYNGFSGGEDIDPKWIRERVDLSQFAGEEVYIRFEYITDGAVNGEGLLLDDISVPEIDYFSDFEDDEGGWDAAGFVRIQNALPQRYRLAMITHGTTTDVQYITLDQDNEVIVPLNINNEIEGVTLVVAGTTRVTRQPAAYRFSVIR